MSSLSAKDRVSLCSFTFSDGRRCRTPRSAGHPHLCSDHARKDSQARAADRLARDLSYSSPANTSPPAISAPPSAALSSAYPAVTSSRAPPAPSPISPKPLSKPSIWPRTSTSMPSTPTAGAGPSAIPSRATTTTSSRPPPNLNNPPLHRLTRLNPRLLRSGRLRGTRLPRSGRICGAHHPNITPPKRL